MVGPEANLSLYRVCTAVGGRPGIGSRRLGPGVLARGHEVVVLAIKKRHHRPNGYGLLPYPIVRNITVSSLLGIRSTITADTSARFTTSSFDAIYCHNVYPEGYVAARRQRGTGIRR